MRRRGHDGRGVRARRRGRPDGHADGVVGRVAGARQLEAGGRRRGGDRHGAAEPPSRRRRCGPCAPSAPRRSSSTPSTNAMAPFGDPLGPVLRRRHGGRDPAERSGRRADRRRAAGGRDRARVRRRLRRRAPRARGSIRARRLRDVYGPAHGVSHGDRAVPHPLRRAAAHDDRGAAHGRAGARRATTSSTCRPATCSSTCSPTRAPAR